MAYVCAQAFKNTLRLSGCPQRCICKDFSLNTVTASLGRICAILEIVETSFFSSLRITDLMYLPLCKRWHLSFFGLFARHGKKATVSCKARPREIRIKVHCVPRYKDKRAYKPETLLLNYVALYFFETGMTLVQCIRDR